MSQLLTTFDFPISDGASTPTRNDNGVFVYAHPTSGAEIRVGDDGFVRYLARGRDAPLLLVSERHDSAELIARAEQLLDRLGVDHSTPDGFRLSRRAPGIPTRPNNVIVTRLFRGQPIVLTGRSHLEVQFDDSFNVDRLELALWRFETLTKLQPLRSIDVFGSDPIDFSGMDWVANQVLAAIPVRARRPSRWAVVPAWDSTIPGWGPVLALSAGQLGDVQSLANERM